MPKVEVPFKIIEVDRAQTLADWTKEDEELLATLEGNPGFNSLVKKLRIQKAFLESALKSTHFDSLEDIARLQSGIQWIGYLEKVVKSEVSKKKLKTPRNPFEVEEAQLKKISEALEIVRGEQVQG